MREDKQNKDQAVKHYFMVLLDAKTLDICKYGDDAGSE